MQNGVLLIDKPAGLSSAQMVARVKKKLGARKVGHAGTLDPDATGLLIILLNGATKVASFASDGDKIYSGVMRLGVVTSTDDMSGEILSQSDAIPDWSEVQRYVDSFIGEIKQVPPKVSAVKVDGKRAYARHRKGEAFELSARSVTVSRFDCVPLEGTVSFEYRIVCSPGTYVRSLARDLGESLGCGGAVESIRREGSGGFSVQDAVSLEDATWSDVRDWSMLVPNLKRIEVAPQVSAGLLNGKESALRTAWAEASSEETLKNEQHVIFYERGRADSLGLLKVIDGSGFGFYKNVGASSTD